MNFITQATLIYIGATPYSAYGSQMPRTSNDIKGMLAPAFKTMMDQGKILTRVDEVGGPHWPESQSFSLHHFLGHTRLERCTRRSRRSGDSTVAEKHVLLESGTDMVWSGGYPAGTINFHPCRPSMVDMIWEVSCRGHRFPPPVRIHVSAVAETENPPVKKESPSDPSLSLSRCLESTLHRYSTSGSLQQPPQRRAVPPLPGAFSSQLPHWSMPCLPAPSKPHGFQECNDPGEFVKIVAN
jgi:hypothetical protein